MKQPATHPREEEAAAYVFGHMEPAEREAFARDLETDALLRQVTDELTDTAAALSLTAKQVVVPPELKNRVLESIKSIPQEAKAKPVPERHRSSGGLIGWAAAAAFAVFCGVLWDKANKAGELLALTDQRAKKAELQVIESRSENEAVKVRLDKAEKTSKDLQQSIAKITEAASVLKQELAKLTKDNKGLEAEKSMIIASRELAKLEIATLKSTIADYKQGVAFVVWDSAKQEGLLKLEKMPPVDANKDYQLWVVDPGHKTPVNAGVVRVDQKGFAKVQFKPNFAIQQADKFALSVEKKVADPGGVPENAGPIIFLSP